MLIGPALRRVVLRHEVSALEQQLGPDGMHWARRMGPRLWPGDAGSARQALPQDLAAAAARLGAALVGRAFDGASPDIARRAALRLPEGADLWLGDLPATLDSNVALRLARSVLEELDPEWLSLFPAHP